MKFLLDQCVPNYVGEVLSRKGHEVIRLRDCLATDSPDPVVVDKAKVLDAILVSLNGDFADITAYPPRNYLGIVALQVRNHPKALVPIMMRLLEYLEQNFNRRQFDGKLLLVEAHRIRIRK